MINTTSIHDAWLGRTAAVEYDNAIQYAGFLKKEKEGEPVKDILPGMVVKDLGNKKMALYDGTGTPFGLASVFRAPTYGEKGIDQVGPNGEFTAIVGTTNTTVRIQADALAEDGAFTLPEDGTAVPLYANADGKVTTTANGPVIGKLLEVGEDGSIVMQLYAPTLA